MRLDKVLKLARPMVGIDLETTGRRPKTAAIVQLALEIFVPGQPVREYKTLVNPVLSIPPEATAIHGITDADVKDAPTFRKLASNLVSGLTDVDFCGKNIKRYDLPLLREEFLRAGVEWSYESAAIVDVERLWQLVEPRKLGDAVARFATFEDEQALGPLNAHDALNDVRWSTRIAANMIDRLTTQPATPAEIHTLEYADDYDADGKLRWLEGGELGLTFSDHADVPLSRVDRGFLLWMLKKDFSPKVKDACRAALNNIRIERV